MTNYVLVYKGGGMAGTEEEQRAAMQAWGAWFGSLGDAVVDGGNPFGQAKSVAADGAVSDGGSSGVTGYSVLKADSLDDAAQKAKGCPILSSGGTIEVYQTIQM